WPAFMERRKVMSIFTHSWGNFYFSLGRGRPKQEIEHVWYTHQGSILGKFTIAEIVFNENELTLPRLRSLSNRESQWQFRPGIYVMVCAGPFVPLSEVPGVEDGGEVFHDSFRGWRYFNFDEYRNSPEAFINI